MVFSLILLRSLRVYILKQLFFEIELGKMGLTDLRGSCCVTVVLL